MHVCTHTHAHPRVHSRVHAHTYTHRETDRNRKREVDHLYQEHHHFVGLRFNIWSLWAHNSVPNNTDSICRGADGSRWKTWIMWLMMLSLFIPNFVPICSLRSNILVLTLVPTVTKGELQISLTFARDALHPVFVAERTVPTSPQPKLHPCPKPGKLCRWMDFTPLQESGQNVCTTALELHPAPVWSSGDLARHVVFPGCGVQHTASLSSPVLDDIRVGDSSSNSGTMNEETLQSVRPHLHVLSYGSFPRPPHLARSFLTCSYASFCRRAQLKILSPSTDIFRDVLSALLIGTLGSLP